MHKTHNSHSVHHLPIGRRPKPTPRATPDNIIMIAKDRMVARLTENDQSLGSDAPILH